MQGIVKKIYKNKLTVYTNTQKSVNNLIYLIIKLGVDDRYYVNINLNERIKINDEIIYIIYNSILHQLRKSTNDDGVVTGSIEDRYTYFKIKLKDRLNFYNIINLFKDIEFNDYKQFPFYKELNEVYSDFYNYKNMIIYVRGNFDMEKELKKNMDHEASYNCICRVYPWGVDINKKLQNTYGYDENQIIFLVNLKRVCGSRYTFLYGMLKVALRSIMLYIEGTNRLDCNRYFPIFNLEGNYGYIGLGCFDSGCIGCLKGILAEMTNDIKELGIDKDIYIEAKKQELDYFINLYKTEEEFDKFVIQHIVYGSDPVDYPEIIKKLSMEDVNYFIKCLIRNKNLFNTMR